MKKHLFFCIFILPILAYAQDNIGTFYGQSAGDLLGYELAISNNGNIIAIAAPSQASPVDRPGIVKVFERDGANWVERGNDILGFQARDFAGVGLAMSGDGSIVAVGAQSYNSATTFTGRVDVYEYDESTNSWTAIGNPIFGPNGSGLGIDLSLSNNGTILAAGGAFANSSAGLARVYEFDGSNWQQRGNDLDGENANDFFGKSLSISDNGNILGVGAYNNDNQGSNSGYVDMLQWDGNAWVSLGNRIEGSIADQVGFSVSLTGNGTVVAISAPSSQVNGTPGSVSVYELNGNIWTERGSSISGLTETEGYGQDVSISSDGNTLVVGAYLNDDAFSNAGKAFIYQFNNGDWVETGTISGESGGDELGWAVAISADASRVMVGAIDDRGTSNINQGGSVQVLDISELLSTESENIKAFRVWPNPTSDIVNIDTIDNFKPLRTLVYDNLGRLVLTSTEAQIDLGSFESGLYLLRISSGPSNVQTIKLVRN